VNPFFKSGFYRTNADKIKSLIPYGNLLMNPIERGAEILASHGMGGVGSGRKKGSKNKGASKRKPRKPKQK
jgi:hypothetical protein